jgi:hypothetical protein
LKDTIPVINKEIMWVTAFWTFFPAVENFLASTLLKTYFYQVRRTLGDSKNSLGQPNLLRRSDTVLERARGKAVNLKLLERTQNLKTAAKRNFWSLVAETHTFTYLPTYFLTGTLGKISIVQSLSKNSFAFFLTV